LRAFAQVESSQAVTSGGSVTRRCVWHREYGAAPPADVRPFRVRADPGNGRRRV